MNDLLGPLTEAQIALLEIIAQPMLDTGRWPNWGYVDARLRRRGFNAREALSALPKVHGTYTTSPAYSLVWCDEHHLQAGSEIRLTIAASLHISAYAPVGEKFVRVLRYVTQVAESHEPDPFEVPKIEVNSEDIRIHSNVDYPFIRALPGILQYEPFNLATYYSGPSDNATKWSVILGEALFEYHGIASVKDYVRAVVKLINRFSTQELARNSVTRILPINAAPQPVADEPEQVPLATYIDSSIIEALQAKEASTVYSLDKLLQLIDELNSGFSDGRPFTCHALLRAILDHVPPAFGFNDFEHVANNYKWSTTDKTYMQHLSKFKAQAHDVMHRPLRRVPSPISMQVFPPSVWVNELLAKVAEII